MTGYKLYIDDGSSGDPSAEVSCGGAALDTTCTASGLTGGVSYSFEVSALSTNGESVTSSVLTQSTAPAAVAVSGMVFSSVAMTSMVLTWTAPSGETPTGYIVYRDDGDSTAMPTPSIVAFEGDALTTTVDGLTGGTTYTYMIAALSGSGVGDVSDESAQSTTPASPLDLSSVSQTSTSISLSWSASVVSGGSAVTSYKVSVSYTHLTLPTKA